MSDEGFLKRWARLKAQPEAAVSTQPVAAPAALAAGTGSAGLASAARPPEPPLITVADGAPASSEPAEPPSPTIADAAALTADSDFSTFVGKNVDAAVRRLAMKKLFADPHFHGHDGLDIYMGDYNLASPVSTGMLADMAHNKNIFAALDEVIEQVDSLADAAATAPAPAEPPPSPEAAAPAPLPPDQEVA